MDTSHLRPPRTRHLYSPRAHIGKMFLYAAIESTIPSEDTHDFLNYFTEKVSRGESGQVNLRKMCLSFCIRGRETEHACCGKSPLSIWELIKSFAAWCNGVASLSACKKKNTVHSRKSWGPIPRRSIEHLNYSVAQTGTASLTYTWPASIKASIAHPVFTMWDLSPSRLVYTCKRTWLFRRVRRWLL